MVIVSRDELAKYPNGTVFTEYVPDMLDSQIHILTGCDGKGYWNGELSLIPFLDDEKCHGNRLFSHTQWCTVDTSINDYDKNQKFAVFSKTEIQQMINALMWALTGCKSYFNEDIWVCDDRVIDDATYYEIMDED